VRKKQYAGGPYDLFLKNPSQRTFILFVQTADAVLKYGDAVLFEAGLSLVKHMLLQLLEAHGGSLTPTEISRMTLREKHDITTLIRRLERDGLIETSRDQTDRRSINVMITEKGRQAIKDTGPVARRVVRDIMSSIPNSTAVELEKTLKILRSNACDSLDKRKKGR
jgi:DNA-binding MarR family transcriptional regulator